MSEQAQHFYALLVGIDDYKARHIRNLRGCVNDALAVQQILRDRYGVPQENIRLLTNAEATYDGIIRSFREHLIGNARRANTANAQDITILFHYSGHGSQAPDPTGVEPDGMDETLVAHDSRVGEVYDIKDYQLGALLDELNRYTENVTVVLDCCHSGSGTRDLDDDSLPLTRRCPPDLRPQPRPEIVLGHDLASTRATRSVVGPSGWLSQGKYVLVAGCRDFEESNEYLARNGRVPRWQGAMTYFFLRELASMNPERLLSYLEIGERVRSHVNAIYPNQLPQVEGDLERLVFAGARPEREPMLSVVEKRDGLIWVSGGIAHNLTAGSELRAYPPEVRTRAEAEAVGHVATLRVVEVGAVTSGCEIVDGNPDVPLHARAWMYRVSYGDLRRTVTVVGADADAVETLRARLQRDDASPYIVLVDQPQGVDFRVVVGVETFRIEDGVGELLVAPFNRQAASAMDDVVRDLNHLVRYRNGVQLENTAEYSELRGQVTLDVKRLDFDPASQEPIALPLVRDPGGEIVVQVGQRVVFEITNHSREPLYVWLFNFASDWSVTPLYPRQAGAQEALHPGRTLSLGLSRVRQEQFAAQIPEGKSDARDIFKVIATREPADFSVLQQGALKTPFETRQAVTRSGGPRSLLEKLLFQAMHGGQTRAYGPPPSAAEDDWTTAQATVLALRADRDNAVDILPGQTAKLPDHQLIVEAPPGFQARVRIVGSSQRTRRIDLEGRPQLQVDPLPPGLAGLGSHLQPVFVPNTRSVDPRAAGAVIEMEADQTAVEAITEDNPLRLRVGGLGSEVQTVIPVAYDGNFFYITGSDTTTADADGDTRIIELSWLPPVDIAPDASRPGRRSLGRTVRLYLYKLVGWSDPTLGLHWTRFVPTQEMAETPLDGEERPVKVDVGEVRYRPVRAGEVQAGQRVALWVHGFASHTPWMLAGPAQNLRWAGVEYDHVLAFDYESFNTGVSENGVKLANELRNLGFGPDDNVHLDVFAHSMGALVARSMIEEAGGDAFVDRLFMAGPPNQGTPLAQVRRFLPVLATLALNAGSGALLIGAAGLLQRVSSDAVGIRDLESSSETLRRLNELTTPLTTRYYILAGRNRIPPEEQVAWEGFAAKLARVSDTVADFILGEDNDLVIGLTSMLGFRNRNYPSGLVETRVVTCNHWGYFTQQDAMDQLEKWLVAAGE